MASTATFVCTFKPRAFGFPANQLPALGFPLNYVLRIPFPPSGVPKAV